MIGTILQMIDNSTDYESFPPSVPNPLHCIGIPDRNSTFKSVKEKFKSYVNLYANSTIPPTLTCYHNAGGYQSINNWCSNNKYEF